MSACRFLVSGGVRVVSLGERRVQLDVNNDCTHNPPPHPNTHTIDTPTHPTHTRKQPTHLECVLGHGVEDVEERLGRELGEVRELERLLLQVVALGEEELGVPRRGACKGVGVGWG